MSIPRLHAPPQTRLFENLDPAWQKAIRKCHEIWFGDIFDSEVKDGIWINLDHYDRSILVDSLKDQRPPFKDRGPISYRWNEFINLATKHPFGKFWKSTIEMGEPVRLRSRTQGDNEKK